jgi:hypothetical protein
MRREVKRVSMPCVRHSGKVRLTNSEKAQVWASSLFEGYAGVSRENFYCAIPAALHSLLRMPFQA